MAIKTINWTSSIKLSCADQTRAACGGSEPSVLICVTSSKIAQKTCCDGVQTTSFAWSTISGTFMGYQKIVQSCGSSFYNYIFSYDDAQIVSSEVLTTPDISGIICEGCLTSFIREQAGNDVCIVQDGPAKYLVNQHGCRFLISGVPN